jgi:hypothetical protein
LLLGLNYSYTRAVDTGEIEAAQALIGSNGYSGTSSQTIVNIGLRHHLWSSAPLTPAVLEPRETRQVSDCSRDGAARGGLYQAARYLQTSPARGGAHARTPPAAAQLVAATVIGTVLSTMVRDFDAAATHLSIDVSVYLVVDRLSSDQRLWE